MTTQAQPERTRAEAPDAPDPDFPLAMPERERTFGELLLDVDSEMVAELEAVGVNVLTRSPEECAVGEQLSLADRLFQSAAKDEAEVSALTAAMRKELEGLTWRYQRLVQQAAHRATQKRTLLEQLARWLFPDAGAKKKSIHLPFGTLGRKDYKPTVELADEAAFLAAAMAELDPAADVEAPHSAGYHAPYVKVTVQLPLVEALEYFTRDEIAAAKKKVEWTAVKKLCDPEGSLPAGVARVEAQTKYYAELVEG